VPELEVALSAQLGAALSDKIDGLGSQIELLGKRIARLAEPPAVIIKRYQSGQAVAAGTLTLDLDGPSLGYVWSVVRVTASAAVLGSQPSSTPAYACIGPNATGVEAAPTGSQYVSYSTAWPIQGTWSPQQLLVQYGERFFFYFTGLSSGQNIIATMQAIQVRASQVERDILSSG
jgi:hypothetical protein